MILFTILRITILVICLCAYIYPVLYYFRCRYGLCRIHKNSASNSWRRDKNLENSRIYVYPVFYFRIGDFCSHQTKKSLWSKAKGQNRKGSKDYSDPPILHMDNLIHVSLFSSDRHFKFVRSKQAIWDLKNLTSNVKKLFQNF